MLSPSVSCRPARCLALPLALGLVALTLLLGVVRTARADVAPLPAQAGASFGAASATNVRLISETVIIQVSDVVITSDGGYVYTQTGATVTADFLLDNPAVSAQSLQVGFPLEIPAKAVDYGGFARLHDLRAFVGGSEAAATITPIGQETWSAWQMSFAPGSTQVRVTYDLPATVDACNAELGYILHTGAAWAGAIGQADLIVRYPYAAEATFISPKGYYLGGPTPGYRVEGNSLHWHYDNLEPTAADDLAVTFVAPECWLPVAAARAALNQGATATNYWHLAEAYADIVFPHHGFYSPLIAQVAEAQYQKALVLEPQNPHINASYAEFLQTQIGGLLPSSRQPDLNQQCLRSLLLASHDPELLYACVPVVNAMIGDPNVSSAAQATAAAVLTVAPLPTYPSGLTHTPAVPTVTATLAASPSPRPSASSTAPSTATPVPPPTDTAPPPASATPLAVAQVSAVAAVSPTLAATPLPSAPPASASPTVLALGALVLLVIVLVGAYYWRSRSAGHPAP